MEKIFEYRHREIDTKLNDKTKISSMKIAKMRALALLTGLLSFYFNVNGQTKLGSIPTVSQQPAKTDWLQSGLSTKEQRLMNADPGISYMATQEKDTSLLQANFPNANITATGKLLLPTAFDKNKKCQIVLVGSPAGVHAQKLAEAGYIVVVFDTSY